jgi:hypothetical protein
MVPPAIPITAVAVPSVQSIVQLKEEFVSGYRRSICRVKVSVLVWVAPAGTSPKKIVPLVTTVVETRLVTDAKTPVAVVVPLFVMLAAYVYAHTVALILLELTNW